MHCLKWVLNFLSLWISGKVYIEYYLRPQLRTSPKTLISIQLTQGHVTPISTLTASDLTRWADMPENIVYPFHNIHSNSSILCTTMYQSGTPNVCHESNMQAVEWKHGTVHYSRIAVLQKGICPSGACVYSQILGWAFVLFPRCDISTSMESWRTVL